jgi:hypothetical protein
VAFFRQFDDVWNSFSRTSLEPSELARKSRTVVAICTSVLSGGLGDEFKYDVGITLHVAFDDISAQSLRDKAVRASTHGTDCF